MVVPVLSSPFLTLPLISSILSPSPDSTSTPPTAEQRVQLLSAKLHLLTNTPSSTPLNHKAKARALADPAPVMSVRLELARAHLAVGQPDLVMAEAELSAIESGSKGVQKRLKKMRKSLRNDNGDSEGEGKGEGDEGYDGDGEPLWVAEIGRIRLEALRVLIAVEQALGREGRARRWQEVIRNLEGI